MDDAKKVALKVKKREEQKKKREALKQSVAKRITEKTGVVHEFEYRFAKPERQYRSDIAFPDVKVAIEIDGGTWTLGRHNRPSHAIDEMTKNNDYVIRGWHTFHCPWLWLESTRHRDNFIMNVCSLIEAKLNDRCV